MENKPTPNITPLKKKRRKITSTAALILAILCFIIGIVCGSSFSSGKQAEEAQNQIEELQRDTEYKLSQKDTEIEAYKEKINQLTGELAEVKKQLTTPVEEEPVATETPEDNESVAVESPEEAPAEKTSGGVLKTLIVIALVVVIIVCIVFAISFFLKKNDEEDEEETEDDEEVEEEIDDEETEDDEE